MKPWTSLLAALVIAVSLLPPAAWPAGAATQIEWDDLVPKGEPIPDPLARLTQDQRFDLEMILWARTLTPAERELAPNRAGVEDAKKYEENFAKAGIQIDRLLADYQAFEEKVRERQKLVNEDLAGKTVRIAGYLLPLEFEESGVTDFLLVPYVGACIHVPPPPPNQIVFVRLAEKLVVTDAYTPVWLEGELKTKAGSKPLTLIDGTKDISIGYHIDGGRAELYKQ